jgi:hypothetical protein
MPQVKVRFLCPCCEAPSRVQIPGAGYWECPHCSHRIEPDGRVTATAFPVCAICGNAELYRKKNFPHSLGLAILTIACIVSFITYLNYEKTLTWIILGGTALFDVALFLWVGDVLVCYRCGASHGNTPFAVNHKPFELGIAERYRQERIRREQLRSGSKQ